MTDAVRFHVEPPGERDRWGVLFRPLLVIPHAILVGGPFVGLGGGAYRTGALGLLAMTARSSTGCRSFSRATPSQACSRSSGCI
jgi:hypothetical protein